MAWECSEAMIRSVTAEKHPHTQALVSISTVQPVDRNRHTTTSGSESCLLANSQMTGNGVIKATLGVKPLTEYAEHLSTEFCNLLISRLNSKSKSVQLDYLHHTHSRNPINSLSNALSNINRDNDDDNNGDFGDTGNKHGTHSCKSNSMYVYKNADKVCLGPCVSNPDSHNCSYLRQSIHLTGDQSQYYNFQVSTNPLLLTNSKNSCSSSATTSGSCDTGIKDSDASLNPKEPTSNTHIKRKPRFSQATKETLQAFAISTSTKPSKAQVIKLAASTNLSKKQVREWFSNLRRPSRNHALNKWNTN
ncbi:hypothetical protein AYI70_g262 [Smittium culicis]|uniref:Homeobox domain-containing protein n=1 Tax=Smittium culicis TaxID=133412 RepID=A0A1R1X731_9FUNG|nr:hypothetical protein AYI70_g10342 [Smittium culicis]OMJ26330.1 hypothetical protein AYI70_g262 [Smittium culicis]